jgi:hypothetical protein
MAGIENKSSRNDKQICEKQINSFNDYLAKETDNGGHTFKEVIEISEFQDKIKWLTEESKESIKQELSTIINRQLEDGIYMSTNKNIEQISTILQKYWFVKNSETLEKSAIDFLDKNWISSLLIYKKEDWKLYFKKPFINPTSYELTNFSYPVIKTDDISPYQYTKNIRSNWLNLSCEK